MPLHVDDSKPDCTRPLEDKKLLYAKTYFNLVSGHNPARDDQTAGPFPTTMGPMGEHNFDPLYSAWPPGPQPTPASWTDDNTGTTWTRVKLDGKWVYRSSRDPRFYIMTSELYELMGVPKNPETGFVEELPHQAYSFEFLIKKYGVWILVGGLALLLSKKGG